MNQPDFDSAVQTVLQHEGVWSNDSYDPGGKTKYGVTQQTLGIYQARTGLLKDVKIEDLSRDEAITIFRWGWWQFDPLASGKIAEKLLDISMNCEGPFTSFPSRSIAVRMLQLACNLVGDVGYMEPHTRRDLDGLYCLVDGTLGMNTIFVANTICNQQGPSNGAKGLPTGEDMLYRAISMYHMQRYVNLCISDPHRLKFWYGWAKRALD